MKTVYRKGNHCVYSIHAHVYFVTRYRRKVLTPEIFKTAEDVCIRVLKANRSHLLEFGGEPDHIHLLLDLHPDNNLSHLCASLKSATSRVLGKQFAEIIRPKIAKGLWGKQLYIRSAGGAPISKLRDYIDSHSYG